MAYQVFIERARDPSPLATASLANAIATRFGLPSEAISARLAQGRFRVKSGVDLTTAERFAADLETLGAVCAIVDEATGQSAPSAQPPAPMPAPIRAPIPTPAASKPAATAPGDYQSGLAAAFGAGAEAQDIGAFGDPASGTFSLATIDGADGTARPQAAAESFGPPDGGAPAADLFAPPEDGEEIALGLDTAAPPPRAPAVAPNLAPAQQEAMLSLLADGAASSDAPAADPAPGNPVLRVAGILANRPGVRTATGAVLAMLLGFLVAHGVGALRESSAFDAPRSNVSAADATYRSTTVGTVEEQAELTAGFQKQRAAQISIMDESRQSIALLCGVIWLIVSVGSGFAFARVVKWDRWA